MKYFLIILLIIFAGCNLNEKKSAKEIAHLYVDILVAEEEYKSKSDSDSLKIVIDSLYSSYQIDEPNYLEQLNNFRYDIETWDNFFAIAEEYLDTLKAQEQRKDK